MKIAMNIYLNPNAITKGIKITKEVFNRFEENDAQDLFDALDIIEDEEESDRLAEFIDDVTIKELKKYITVDEDSIRFDEGETYECGSEWLAYLVDIDFDTDKILAEIKNIK